MADYDDMYYTLFNGITDAIELLKSAQKKAEELYIMKKPKNISFEKSSPDIAD